MKVPEEVKEYIWSNLEEGAKIFYFENFDFEEAFFVDHIDGNITIVSWNKTLDKPEISYCNIDKNIRNMIAKEFKFEN